MVGLHGVNIVSKTCVGSNSMTGALDELWKMTELVFIGPSLKMGLVYSQGSLLPYKPFDLLPSTFDLCTPA
jgi:hypothetical protein